MSNWRTAIQAGVRWPLRGDRRTDPEVEQDLEDEFAFHIEEKTRSLMSEGWDAAEAARRARDCFGDMDRIRRTCKAIATEERIMLQRINFIMMVVVMLVVIGVAVHVMITQRYNTLALQAITTDLARMKFDDAAKARATDSTGVVYVEGDVSRAGVFNLPASPVTLRRMIASAGGARASKGVVQLLRMVDGKQTVIVELPLPLDQLPSEHDPELQPNDMITIIGAPAPVRRVDAGFAAPAAGLWRQVAEGGAQIADGGELVVMPEGDIRNLHNQAIGTLRLAGFQEPFELYFFVDRGAKNLDVRNRELSYRDEGPNARWMIDETGRMSINLSGYLPAMSEPLIFAHVENGIQETPSAQSALETERAKAKAVSDFLAQVLASADPQTASQLSIAELLDRAEADLATKYADDPAVQASLRELIAERRRQLDEAADPADTEAP